MNEQCRSGSSSGGSGRLGQFMRRVGAGIVGAGLVASLGVGSAEATMPPIPISPLNAGTADHDACTATNVWRDHGLEQVTYEGEFRAAGMVFRSYEHYKAVFGAYVETTDSYVRTLQNCTPGSPSYGLEAENDLGFDSQMIFYFTDDTTVALRGDASSGGVGRGSSWHVDVVWGEIADKAFDTPTYMGWPVGSQFSTPRKEGEGARFEGGMVYRSGRTGAHEVHGNILIRWAEMGYENSLLGFPTTDEFVTPDGRGRANGFEYGLIYWTPATNAHPVHGAILERFKVLNYEQGVLGYPVQGEFSTPHRSGAGQRFEKGMVYYSAGTGAHQIGGNILNKWAAIGYEDSVLGFPRSDELTTPNKRGKFNQFEHGLIYWTPNTGAHAVYGSILDEYAAQGYENSRLGFPTSDEFDLPGGGRQVYFENGCRIEWKPGVPGRGTEVKCN